MNNSERICKLCFKSFESIKVEQDVVNEILDVLQLNVDFALNEKSVICTKCVEDLEKYFKFKLTCLSTQNYIQSFVNPRDEKLDLKDIYSNKIENADVIISDDHIICRFCLDSLKISSSVSLFNDEEGMILKNMVDKCLPELDLSITNRPVICSSCHASLQNYFSFLVKFMKLEENVKKYCIAEGINDKDRVKLNHILKFTLNDWCEQEDNKVDIIKVEHVAHEENDKEFDHKHEHFMEEQETDGVCTLTDADILNSKKEEMVCEERKDEDDYKGGSWIEIHDQEFLSCDNVDMKIKTEQLEFGSLQDNVVLSQSEVSAKLFQKEKCMLPVATRSSSDNSVGNLKNIESHKPIQKTRSEKKYQCAFCLYKTSYKHVLKKHFCDREKKITMHKCEHCSYQTKRKDCLRQHILVHKNPSEVVMFKCEFCPYETKHKNYLQRHIVIHKNPSEIMMYRCEYCPYETKQKDYLRKHIVIHKSHSEITLFKCESCSYQTKRKRNLQSHLLIHKKCSEVTMFKCESCPYETKRKNSLRKHIVIHQKKTSEITFMCQSCSFQTKHKQYLSRHMLIHKSSSEIMMYECASCPYKTKRKVYLQRHIVVCGKTIFKCEFCAFETKQKYNLERHMLTHKSPSEIVMYKCEFCPYETKHKDYLQRHIVVHKSQSEITMFNCASCSYQTKHKRNLQSHMLIHRSSSEITLLKCESCPYETKHKQYLRKHILVHKNPAEITMFKCDSCSYQTKRKRNLQSHILVHKNPSEKTMFKCDSCSYQTKSKRFLKIHVDSQKC